MLIHAAACALGAVCHLTFFNRGEHHMYGARYVQVLIAGFITSLVAHVQYGGWSLSIAAGHVSAVIGSFLAGLYTSLLLYRAFFSPLCRFPGPFGARLSDVYLSAHLGKQDACKQVHRLHQKYGDLVRIGSNTLSIAHPLAVNVVYGHGSRCRKSDWYDLTKPMVSMQTARRRDVHDQRRRVWSTAFSDRAMRGYEERIRGFQDQFMAKLRAMTDEPVDISKWVNLYMFDVMGDLAFGTAFDMMVNEQHWAIELLNGGLTPLAFMLPVWLFRMAVAVPRLAADYWNFIAYCQEQVEARMKTDPKVPDIMSALLAPYSKEAPDRSEMQMLHGDSQLVIVAGSDTTSTSLAFIFQKLMQHPEHISKLRVEFASCAGSDGSLAQNQDLQYLDHLNAVINETLRLHPPVPTALQRLTPPEGLSIDGTFVPGNTVVFCPQYALGRSEAAYVQPNDFIPERWTSRPDLLREKGAFAPFSTGAYGCIGRPLALLNLRTTLARLLTEFDISLAPGEKGVEIEERMKEHFTLVPGPLRLSFQARTGDVRDGMRNEGKDKAAIQDAGQKDILN